MAQKSRFAKIFAERDQQPAQTDTGPATAANVVTATPKRRGKYADPDYTHTTVYLRKAVLLGVKKKLLDQPRDQQELSALVETLLTEWLNR